MSRGVFVTGTDTGIGKTVAVCALVHAIAARGVAVHPMKPVAAGATHQSGRWVNEDSVALMTAAGLSRASLDAITPLVLREAMAPHIAARHEGRRIELAPLVQSFERLAAHAFVVVEGVGGFDVPLDDDLDTVDLAQALALPLVLVVGMRLGCLNHALLTKHSIESAGLVLAGWIANTVDPHMPAAEENVAALAERLGAPLLGRFPHATPPEPTRFAALLDVSPLLHHRRA